MVWNSLYLGSNSSGESAHRLVEGGVLDVTRFEQVSHPQAFGVTRSLIFVLTCHTDFALDHMWELWFLWDIRLSKGPDKGPTGSYQCPDGGRKEE